MRRAKAKLLLAALMLTMVAAPAAAQPRVGEVGTFLIRGGTVITVAGQQIENASVLLQDGRIAGVGTNVTAPADATVIDATGKFVYPGMIDSYTPLGLTEVGGINTMNLRSEIGDFNPHNRAVVALNMDSEMMAVTRANGVTNVLTTPSSGIMSGQAALINTAGWTWEDIAVKPTAAFVINYPREPSFRFGPDPDSEQRRTAQERVDEDLRALRTVLSKARDYERARAAGAPMTETEYEALRPLMRGEIPAIVSADTEEQIRGAFALADSFGIRIILYGADDAWKMADEIAQKNVPIVLGSIQSTPDDDEPYDAIYAAPGVLHRAGIKFAFSTGSGANSRDVPYHAALAVAYGLPADVALRALTLTPAEIFGVDDQLGSIEVGKLANLFVATGDPLDVRTQMTDVFIKGRHVPPDDRHHRFYEKYNARPKK
ncbi:MAG: amidohydrolase family protein [Longimicrobiales bacterium]